MRSEESIVAVSPTRVASIGLGNLIYLHEVDFESKKLILLKQVVVSGAQILHNKLGHLSSSSFMCLTRNLNLGPEARNNCDGALLKFDMNLNLRAHLKLKGSLRLKSVYPVGEKKVMFFFGHGDWSVFVINLETGSARFETIQTKGSSFYYSEDEESGRVFHGRLFGDKIIKVFCN